MIQELFGRGPLAPSAIRRSLPVLLLIAGMLTIGYMVFRQLGYDARTIQVVDAVTGETRELRIVTLLPRDAISAVTRPRFLTPEQAERWMNPSERVIGVEIDGEAKAYPINLLSRHEIVDDVVGGKPVAVTW